MTVASGHRDDICGVARNICLPGTVAAPNHHRIRPADRDPAKPERDEHGYIEQLLHMPAVLAEANFAAVSNRELRRALQY